MDRFLDDTNIKKKTKSKNITDKIEFAQATIKKVQEQVQSLSDEDKELLVNNNFNVHKAKKEILDKLNIPNNEIIKKPEEATNLSEQYEQEVNKIMQESPELVPEEKPALDIQLQQPAFIINRDKNGKIKMETEQFKSLNDIKEDNMDLNKNMILQKQAEANQKFEEAKLELEILTRMRNSVEKALQPTYDIKIKDQQKKIKEMDLRRSVITNILEGR